MSLKHINKGSSFEDIVAASPAVKTDFQSNKQFELQRFLNFWISSLNDVSSFGFCWIHASGVQGRSCGGFLVICSLHICDTRFRSDGEKVPATFDYSQAPCDYLF
jgi:hypothetical protein